MIRYQPPPQTPSGSMSSHVFMGLGLHCSRPYCCARDFLHLCKHCV